MQLAVLGIHPSACFMPTTKKELNNDSTLPAFPLLLPPIVFFAHVPTYLPTTGRQACMTPLTLATLGEE